MEIKHSVNQERLQLWLTALRSGEFAQAKGQLAVRAASLGETGYCCLGVACVVAAADDPALAVAVKSDLPHEVLLPTYIADWLGLKATTTDVVSPRTKYDGELVPLTTLNDEYDLSFAEIADLIETEGLYL